MRIIIIIVVMLIANFSEASWGKTKWGMTQKQIKKAYPGAIKVNAETMGIEKKTVAGKEATVLFILFEDQLTRVVVIFTEKHYQKSLYRIDFANMSALLDKKYKEPTEREILWTEPNYKALYDSDQAFTMCGVAYYSEWQFAEETVQHSIECRKYKYTHKILYWHNKLDAERKKKETEQNSNEL